MPKPSFIPAEEALMSDLIETFLAGHKEWRPDLEYPESHSDMKAGMMAVLTMFEVRRRPTAKPLSMPCGACKGIGAHIDPKSTPHFHECVTCHECGGRGKVPYK